MIVSDVKKLTVNYGLTLKSLDGTIKERVYDCSLWRDSWRYDDRMVLWFEPVKGKIHIIASLDATGISEETIGLYNIIDFIPYGLNIRVEKEGFLYKLKTMRRFYNSPVLGIYARGNKTIYLRI